MSYGISIDFNERHNYFTIGSLSEHSDYRIDMFNIQKKHICKARRTKHHPAEGGTTVYESNSYYEFDSYNINESDTDLSTNQYGLIIDGNVFTKQNSPQIIFKKENMSYEEFLTYAEYQFNDKYKIIKCHNYNEFAEYEGIEYSNTEHRESKFDLIIFDVLTINETFGNYGILVDDKQIISSSTMRASISSQPITYERKTPIIFNGVPNDNYGHYKFYKFSLQNKYFDYSWFKMFNGSEFNSEQIYIDHCDADNIIFSHEVINNVKPHHLNKEDYYNKIINAKITLFDVT